MIGRISQRMEMHQAEYKQLRIMRLQLQRLKPENPVSRAIVEEIRAWLQFHNSRPLKRFRQILEKLQNNKG